MYVCLCLCLVCFIHFPARSLLLILSQSNQPTNQPSNLFICKLWPCRNVGCLTGSRLRHRRGWGTWSHSATQGFLQRLACLHTVRDRYIIHTRTYHIYTIHIIYNAFIYISCFFCFLPRWYSTILLLGVLSTENFITNLLPPPHHTPPPKPTPPLWFNLTITRPTDPIARC